MCEKIRPSYVLNHLHGLLTIVVNESAKEKGEISVFNHTWGGNCSLASKNLIGSKSGMVWSIGNNWLT